ncbi:unnamed protein product [Protopolystoma xenopodis]|uniref:BolA-like protein n=1 Tax=Protopolystoma xenopodis TaxID=117903 RepID=A0A448W9V9_9PLAT|nr:unnamed protein product [Protopolystoma xenopodis]
MDALIKTRLQVLISDFSDNCGYKFDVFIVCDAFEGKKLIERHRLVHEALKNEMSEIHALTLKTLTTKQYQEHKLLDS